MWSKRTIIIIVSDVMNGKPLSSEECLMQERLLWTAKMQRLNPSYLSFLSFSFFPPPLPWIRQWVYVGATLPNMLVQQRDNLHLYTLRQHCLPTLSQSSELGPTKIYLLEAFLSLNFLYIKFAIFMLRINVLLLTWLNRPPFPADMVLSLTL